MAIDWQLVAVAAAGVLATGYLARAAWRTWFGAKPGCGAGCGTCASPPPPTANPPGRISLPQV